MTTQLRMTLTKQSQKVYQRRTRAKKTTKAFLRQQLEREADLIESVIKSVRRAL